LRHLGGKNETVSGAFSFLTHSQQVVCSPERTSPERRCLARRPKKESWNWLRHCDR